MGWGPNAFPGPYGYWWVPVVGPLIGGSLGVALYKYFIADTLSARAECAAAAEDAEAAAEESAAPIDASRQLR
jgi:glycerol uptake facilitator protein